MWSVPKEPGITNGGIPWAREIAERAVVVNYTENGAEDDEGESE